MVLIMTIVSDLTCLIKKKLHYYLLCYLIHLFECLGFYNLSKRLHFSVAFSVTSSVLSSEFVITIFYLSLASYMIIV